MLKRKKGTECLNCGTNVEGANFCSECGQVNDTRRLSTWELIGESLSNFFAVDGRIFRTIGNVFWRPGIVAKDFSAGKRVKYMNPVRFYFVASLLLITTIQLDRDARIVNGNPNEQGLEVIDSMSEEELELARIKVIDEYLGQGHASFLARLKAMTELIIYDPEVKQETVFEQLGISESFWNEFTFAQAKKAASFADNQVDNLAAFNKFLISKLFWILFLFIPVLGLLLKLIYIRSDVYYPEHIFFALYQQGLFFIASAIYNILSDNQGIFVLVLVWFAVHLVMAMKTFYNQAWSKTIFKFGLISLLGLIGFSVFFILSLVFIFILM